jgi:cyanophycin synthetase
LTYGGRAEFMIQNVLAATLACFVHGISLEDIRVGLTTFTPSTAQTPGRMNFVEMGDFTVLMDFAHNPAGIIGLRNFINKLSYEKRTAVLSGVGDRRDEDLHEVGRLCAETFDKIIIRRGDYLRGRNEEEVFKLLQEGIKESGKKPDVEIIHESGDAIFNAFDNAVKGELVVILADTVSKDIEYVNQYRDKLNSIELSKITADQKMNSHNMK